jgi:two-component system cell cycle response regulator DivK
MTAEGAMPTEKDTRPEQDPTEKRENQEAIERRQAIPKGTTILVVEDNVANFVLIARLLGYMGVHCEWKTSGYEVMEYADGLGRLDLILMDLRLPYEDGYEALHKIRSSPRLKDTLVVAVTAEANAEAMRKARQAGFDGFIGKPLDADRFPEQIRRILCREPVWEWS